MRVTAITLFDYFNRMNHFYLYKNKKEKSETNKRITFTQTGKKKINQEFIDSLKSFYFLSIYEQIT